MLENCPLFAEFEPKDIESIRTIVQVRNFADGQEIFREGDGGDGMYIVEEGRVLISGLVADNVRHEYSKFSKGEVFGEMAVLEEKPRSATATAVGQTKVCFIPRVEMLRLVGENPKLALALVRNISRRLREFNRQYIQEIVQAERLSAVGRFARSIVHDLKNPLNIISLSAEMSAMDNSTPEMRHKASVRIAAMVERINEMVGEILEFTQGSSHHTSSASPMDYSLFVTDLVDEIRAEIELKSVTILLENAPPPVKVLMDVKRLQRVFFNLIHNATDAVDGGGTVRLRFKLTGNELTTEIEDDGPGIAPQIADHLFDAFATYGKAHGTGLGLSICKKIIQDHKGKISARNSSPRGAILSFTLPLAEE